MSALKLRGASHLSFILKVNGEILPAMPDDEEFSAQELEDFVAGPPEVICETAEGFLLFHNKESRSRNLALNDLATSVYPQPSDKFVRVYGRAFLAHPDHVPSYWKKQPPGRRSA